MALVLKKTFISSTVFVLLVLLMGCRGLFADFGEFDPQDDPDVGIDADVGLDADGDGDGEPRPPQVYTSASGIAAGEGIVLRGMLRDPGLPEAFEVGFCVESESLSDFAECYTAERPGEDDAFERASPELTAGIAFQVRAYAENEEGRVYGELVDVRLDFADVVVGEQHSCARAEDQSLWCWGRNQTGQLGVGSESVRLELPHYVAGGPFEQVTVGTRHTCAIDGEGQLWCWGDARFGAVGVSTAEGDDFATTPRQVVVDADAAGELLGWAVVAAGDHYSCAIDENQKLWCWGQNPSGVLGVGDTRTYRTPRQVGEKSWQALAAGLYHACGIDTGGTLFCWGNGRNGAIGHPVNMSMVPVEVPGAEGYQWRELALGVDFGCALTTEGAIYCWGLNDQGQLGLGSDESSYTYTPQELAITSNTGWEALSAGRSHACAQKSGRLYCWGNGNYGRLGLGDHEHRFQPVQVAANQQWRAISAGPHTSCAVTAGGELHCWGVLQSEKLQPFAIEAIVLEFDDESLAQSAVSAGGRFSCATRGPQVYCWGAHDNGALGIGGAFEQLRDAPTLLPAHSASQLSSNLHHNCSRSSGELSCWGRGSAGQLGDQTNQDRFSPVFVFSTLNQTWSQVSVGGFHTCGIDNTGRLWCWGLASSGRLGHSHQPTNRPGLVGDGAWKEVAAGFQHTCAIDIENQLHCWGSNIDSALGLGDLDEPEATRPQRVGHAANWAQVSTFHRHSCALDTEGWLWCWGRGLNGQLGDGQWSNRAAPTMVAEVNTSWKQVSVGYRHTCAISSEDQLWCWGANLSAQLGVGDLEHRLKPTLVDADRRWLAVFAGRQHTLAVDENGRLFAWGSNLDGQLGTGTAWALEPTSFLPFAVANLR